MKDLPTDQRPREKLLSRGASALTDAELLALLLRTGYKGCGVVALAQQLLDTSGGYTGLLQASNESLKSTKGLGPAKRAELLAVVEIARRALAQQLQKQPVFDDSKTLKDYVGLQLGGRGYEVFAVLFFDAHHHLLGMEDLFRGTVTQTTVYPREVVRRALALNASSVVLAHNHPSGVAEPSRADSHLTQTLQAALRLIDVKVLDHLVVGQGEVVSMQERGLM
jgi:DNA repair protein RadC